MAIKPCVAEGRVFVPAEHKNRLVHLSLQFRVRAIPTLDGQVAGHRGVVANVDDVFVTGNAVDNLVPPFRRELRRLTTLALGLLNDLSLDDFRTLAMRVCVAFTARYEGCPCV
jgi:hypothetical protein